MVIAVTSGKGGTGKSTVAAGLGSALCRRGKSVLLLDLDQGLRCLDFMLGAGAQSVYDLGDLLSGRCSAADAVVPVSDASGLYLLPAPPRAGMVTNAEGFQRLLQMLSPLFDVILVDGPAGIGSGFSLCVLAVESALLISTPDPVCVRDAAVTARLLREAGLRARLIINRVRPRLIQEGVLPDFDQIIDGIGLQLLGALPEDPAVSVAAATGKPLKEGVAAEAFDRIAARLSGRHVLLPPMRDWM